MTCKLPEFGKKQSAIETLATLLGAGDLALIPNGSVKRFTTFVGDGAATVQLERVQNTFAIFRRVLFRVPVLGSTDTLIALYADGKGWVYKIRPAPVAPVLFHAQPCKSVALTPRPLSPGLAKLRERIAQYSHEGEFLDWLAYKSPYEWVADSIHDLAEDQVAMLLDHLEAKT